MTSVTLEKSYTGRRATFRSTSDNNNNNNSIKPEHVLGFFVVVGGLIVGLQMKIENTSLKNDNLYLRTELVDAATRTVVLSNEKDGLIHSREMAEVRLEAYESAYNSLAYKVDSFRIANESLTARNNAIANEMQASGSALIVRNTERDGLIFKNDMMQAKLELLEDISADKKSIPDSSGKTLSLRIVSPN